MVSCEHETVSTVQRLATNTSCIRYDDDDDVLDMDMADAKSDTEEESIDYDEQEEEAIDEKIAIFKGEEKVLRGGEGKTCDKEKEKRIVVEGKILVLENPNSDASSPSIIRSSTYDRDWMEAFQVICHLLWLAKAWVQFAAFVNRFCTRRQ
jgi:hypothetical protein